ncbi:aminotransferase [Bombiscardovia apis]|uniref:alanine transaminase n=1 Tax=Bombiscardovia apis TaxID=2932182 RepID=A0ABN6SFW3_9BIFI|nr:pyridoxal phosphate-dependent aminotransferase [Bombiscardovia apis]BDR54897.1 aminotransferase [Bombiscardovia apis]
MQFSNRTGSTRLNPIAQAQARASQEGRALRSLNDSNPTKHGLGLPQLGVYGAEPRGPLTARQALADFLSQRGGSVSPGDVYLLSSTSQAYSWLMKLLCNPGDIVLEPRPGYPLIESIAQLEGLETRSYLLQYDGSWTIDLARLTQLIEGSDGSRVRAIVLINPNNPTGSYLHGPERERIVELCREHDIAIIADEVFYDYSLQPLPRRGRLAGEQGVLTFALDGFSKILAAPQAKVGWIQVSGLSNEVEEAKRRLDLIADDYLPMSSIVADQIPALLSQVPAQTHLVQERCLANLGRLQALLAAPQCPVSLLHPEAGWNVLLRFPAVIDENELILYLIERYGLTGQPGYFFDMSANGYIALSLLPEPSAFEEGVRSFLEAVEALLS